MLQAFMKAKGTTDAIYCKKDAGEV